MRIVPFEQAEVFEAPSSAYHFEGIGPHRFSVYVFARFTTILLFERWAFALFFAHPTFQVLFWGCRIE